MTVQGPEAVAVVKDVPEAPSRVSRLVSAADPVVVEEAGDAAEDAVQAAPHVVVAAAVLHHMRNEADWTLAFSQIYSLLKSGGILLVSDLIRHENPAVEALFKVRQESFLHEALGDAEAERIMQSIADSDTPSPLEYQFDLLKKTGFRETGLLHKNIVFGAYYALK